MPTSSPHTIPPSSTTMDDLHQHLTLLQSLHRRNKNQHRRSHWYKHFDHFRRQLAHLLHELSPDPAPPPPPPPQSQQQQQQRPPPATDAESLKAHLAAAERRRAQREEALQRARARLHVWRTVFLERWYVAFSRLVADRRFAPLGVVLVAAVARVGGCLGILEQPRLETEWGDGEAPDGTGEGDVELEGRHGAGEDDVGVRVERGAVEAQERLVQRGEDEEFQDEMEMEREGVKEMERDVVASRPRKKRRGKRSDAIDDLFSGLI